MESAWQSFDICSYTYIHTYTHTYTYIYTWKATRRQVAGEQCEKEMWTYFPNQTDRTTHGLNSTCMYNIYIHTYTHLYFIVELHHHSCIDICIHTYVCTLLWFYSLYGDMDEWMARKLEQHLCKQSMLFNHFGNILEIFNWESFEQLKRHLRILHEFEAHNQKKK